MLKVKRGDIVRHRRSRIQWKVIKVNKKDIYLESITVDFPHRTLLIEQRLFNKKWEDVNGRY